MNSVGLTQIRASAGSGKTFTLTRCYLELLRHAGPYRSGPTCAGTAGIGFSWPEILAVTFTNKAAAEMKERVVASLKKRALDLPESTPGDSLSPELAERSLRRILRNAQQLNIRTIDSLLALLARLFALEIGVNPDFELCFDPNVAFEPLYERFLARCDSEGREREMLEYGVQSLLSLEKPDGFWVGAKLQDRFREVFARLLAAEGDFLTDPSVLLRPLQTACDALVVEADAMLRAIDDGGYQANANFLKLLDKCAKAHPDEKAPSSAYLSKSCLAECMNKASKDAVTDADDAIYARLREAAEAFARLAALTELALRLAPAVNVARELMAGVDALSRERNMLLHQTLSGRVREMLDTVMVSEAYCRLGARLSHILVDEFQDTARDQWSAIAPLALECLSKGGGFLYVGDVKQAIYGWRGGDARLFDEVAADPQLAAVCPTPSRTDLPKNWRSRRVVIEFNNAVFSRLETPDGARLMAESMLKGGPETEVRALTEAFRRDFAGASQEVADETRQSGGYVRLQWIETNSAPERGEETERLLEELLRDDILLRRPYGDVAVLVRTNTQATMVSDWLVKWRIPVVTENSLQISRHPLIRQLTAFLAFLTSPGDDLAFMEIVLGDELFLAEADIGKQAVREWLATRGSGPLHRRFREAFPNAWTELLEPFYRYSGLLGPYDTVRELLRAFRVLERHPDDEIFVRRFLEIIHLAEQSGHGSASAFLALWNDSGDAERVPMPARMDAVRVMTMHKAKGLEFPVTIVPFHDKSINTTREIVELAPDGTVDPPAGPRLLTPLRKELGLPYHRRLREMLQEETNLLYVAWTRAVEELYGFIAAPTDPDKSRSRVARGILALLEDEFDENGILTRGIAPVREVDASPAPDTITASPPLAERALPTRGGPVSLMDWLPRLKVYRHSLEETRADERMRGEALHRALELLRPGDVSTEADRALDLALEEFPALAPLAESLRAEFASMAAWVCGHPQLRKLLHEGRREVSLLDESGQAHRPDLLVRTGSGFRVVDWKTGSPSPEHHQQVRRYMRLLERMPRPDDSAKPEVHGLLVYLDRREVVEVSARGSAPLAAPKAAGPGDREERN